MRKKKTQEEFVETINKITNGEYNVIGEYKGKRVKVRLKHNVCSYEWEVTPDNFVYQGNRCPNCANKMRVFTGRKQISNDEFLLKVKNKFGNKFTILSEYSPAGVLVRHECGYEYEVIPYDFFKKRTDKCPNCIKNKNKTHDDFIKEIKSIVGDEYKVLSKYKGSRTKVKMKHEICGCIWDVKPTLFLHNGNRCPNCNESKGEKKIRRWLENNNIIFEAQKEFDGLIGIGNKNLRFDFAVYNSYKNINFLIEYDGEFHFKKQYKDDHFEMLQIHDELKNNFCKINNIKLLRIPYWEFDNIENMLYQLFAKFIDNKEKYVNTD
jgi:hypothetical protein